MKGTAHPGKFYDELLIENRFLKRRVKWLERRVYQLETGEEAPDILQHPAVNLAFQRFEQTIEDVQSLKLVGCPDKL